jgi:putative ABC transport system permease protein
MTVVSSWRTALRIARREARRSKGRSTLVVAMIAMPVLCLAFAASSYDMFSLTAQERADRAMGTSDARVRWSARDEVLQDIDGNAWMAHPETVPSSQADKRKDEPPPPTAADLLGKLPAGSRLLPLRTGTVALKTAQGIGQPNAISVDARDPLTNKYLKILEGRAPESASEVALTKQAVTRLGQGMGGTVTSGDRLRKYTVVGLVEFPSMLQQVVLFAPIPVSDDEPAGLSLGDNSWLVSTPAPVTWTDVRHLNTFGISVASRQVFLDPPPQSEVPNTYASGSVQPKDLALGVLVAGLALLEIVLLAGPAFAVSARRRQRQLALVAANGGTPAHIRRIVLADGVVLGAIGAGSGVVLGIAAAFAARPLMEEYLAGHRAGGYRVFPAALAAIAVLAVMTGVLAALVPAFITARQNVVASLAGRRGATRSRKRWIVVGLVMVAAGAGITIFGSLITEATIMLGGLVLGELGLVLCTPALVGLIARLGRWLPVAPRIALRDAGRNRAAAAPAISAVMAAVAGSIAVGLYLQSNITMQEMVYQPSAPPGYATIYLENGGPNQTPDLAGIEKAVRSTLPVTDVRPVRGVECLDGDRANRYCALQIQLPEELRCPYADEKKYPGPLSKDEQKIAAADPRCNQRGNFSQFAYTVDDGTAMAVLTAASPDDVAAATKVLQSGGVIVANSSFIRDGKAVVEVIESTFSEGRQPEETTRTISAPAYAMTSGTNLGNPIVSPGLVTAAGMQVSENPRQLLAATSRMPTEGERDKFQDEMQKLGVPGMVDMGPEFQIPIELWIIMGAAALITLGAAGIGTGLAAADGRADLSTLAAVGASPRLRRGLSLSQSSVIAGLGSVLGAIAGLGAAVSVLFALNQRYVDAWPAPIPRPIVMPWLSLGVAVVVVPLIAILGAGLITRSRLPIERRT